MPTQPLFRADFPTCVYCIYLFRQLFVFRTFSNHQAILQIHLASIPIFEITSSGTLLHLRIYSSGPYPSNSFPARFTCSSFGCSYPDQLGYCHSVCSNFILKKSSFGLVSRLIRQFDRIRNNKVKASGFFERL